MLQRCGLKFDGSCWCVWQEGTACRRNSAGSLRGAFFLYAPVWGPAGRWQMTRTCWGTCGSAGSPPVSPWTRTSSPRERPSLTMWVSPTAFSRHVTSTQPSELPLWFSLPTCEPQVRDKAPNSSSKQSQCYYQQSFVVTRLLNVQKIWRHSLVFLTKFSFFHSFRMQQSPLFTFSVSQI